MSRVILRLLSGSDVCLWDGRDSLSSIKKGGVKDTHDMIDMVEEKLKATGKKIEG